MNVYLTDGTEEGFYTAAFYACTDAGSTITSQKNVQLALDASSSKRPRMRKNARG